MCISYIILVKMGTRPEQMVTTAVVNYYKAAREGYWGYLDGTCHYGYSDLNDQSPFNMKAAQYKMECLLGGMLGLASGAKVLDAGCGYGPVARTLTREFGYKVTGIDLMEERLRDGLKKNENCDASLDLVNASYQAYPFADETFDGAYFMETLVHAPNYQDVLCETKRVLKPGGKIVFFEYSIPPLQSVPRVARYFAERIIRKTGMASLPFFTHGSFTTILHEAGFENAQASDISKNVYPSWFYLWQFAMWSAWKEIKKGRLGLDIFSGSAYIWPARHRLGYNICKATKPLD